MQTHPFTDSIVRKMAVGLLLLLAVSLHCSLLLFYESTSFPVAFTDSLIAVFLWGVAAYISWYVFQYARIWSARLVIAMGVQLVWISLLFFILCLTGLESTEAFYASVPIRLLTGLLAWIVLIQWYDTLDIQQEPVTEMLEEEGPLPMVPTENILDRISVKDGSRIHIIHPEELLYIQACGDYVNLFTEQGQYIKEQTMKYLEAHLPSSFVRIHRSCIVNVEQILRIELFGKESYHVRLKNGVTLRASISGYKLLKQHLNL